MERQIKLKDEVLSVTKSEGITDMVKFPITTTNFLSRIYINITGNNISITYREVTEFYYPEMKDASWNPYRHTTKKSYEYTLLDLTKEVYNELMETLSTRQYLSEVTGTLDLFCKEGKAFITVCGNVKKEVTK